MPILSLKMLILSLLERIYIYILLLLLHYFYYIIILVTSLSVFNNVVAIDADVV